jgi:hypothetical protein
MIFQWCNRLVVCCCLILITVDASARNEKYFAHFSLGYGGGSFAKFNSKGMSDITIRKEQKSFYQAGLEFGYRFNNHIALAAGASWQHYGYTIFYNTPSLSGVYHEVKQDYLSLPLYLQYNTNPDGNYGLFVNAGLRYLIAMSTDVGQHSWNYIFLTTDNFKKTSLAPMLNPGLYIRLGPGGLFQIGPDLQYHLSDTFDEESRGYKGERGHLWQLSAKLSLGFFF